MPPITAPERVVLLRAGRGNGWLAARDAGPRAIDEVMALVLDDPRWDRQVEQRADYYATLLLALAADLQPLVARSQQGHAEERDAWLLFEVLGALDQRGQETARAALRAAGASGPNVEAARTALELIGPHEPPTQPRHTAALEVESSVIRPEEQLAHIESFLRGDASKEARYPMLQRAERSRERRHWLRALDALPVSIKLPHVRPWLDAPWPLSLAAERVLADHATEEDRQRIEERVEQALESRAYYRLCSLVEALGTIGSIASLPTLCRVHDETAYSYARRAALGSLATHLETDALRTRAREGLWDCDSATRALAADCCDVTDLVVRARLVTLASDPFEARDVREAATEAVG